MHGRGVDDQRVRAVVLKSVNTNGSVAAPPPPRRQAVGRAPGRFDNLAGRRFVRTLALTVAAAHMPLVTMHGHANQYSSVGARCGKNSKQLTFSAEREAAPHYNPSRC